MKNEFPIYVRGLRKSYGDFEAIKGIDFEVRSGEVFGLLGPNGAGKTSTIEILEGLRPRSDGEVKVLDLDPDRQKKELKDRIGACLQATNLPDKITVREALDFFGSLYSRKADTNALLKRLQLEEKKDAGYATLSGGQKQRLALALALINDPQLLFLDEPTTGLDPQVRLEIRDLIQELRADNRTILMTTHYIEEAERLCDRVAVIDAGQIIALGRPRDLQEKSANQSAIEIRLNQPLRDSALPSWPESVRSIVSDDRQGITVYSKRPARTLVEIVKWIDSQGLELDDIHLNRPTLEDVFIELTGKKLRD
ncbi:MAG TPA: ABC transporter ATP-binding protein [Chthoniobacterales bacterium]|nr:ABC transporter ATP-binding protein [Chthoniobacterales bacterium]